ncbi:3-methyl-2-oxobutanoate hydroxymethyltransferase [Bacillus stratosphericus LAMA 585]|nr:3-methyl-2-oxobutanoate hydroxymethyltransferase [Bacillus stratosphericus LAMA 585]
MENVSSHAPSMDNMLERRLGLMMKAFSYSKRRAESKTSTPLTLRSSQLKWNTRHIFDILRVGSICKRTVPVRKKNSINFCLDPKGLGQRDDSSAHEREKRVRSDKPSPLQNEEEQMKTKLDFFKMKEQNEPIVMLTAYDYPAAKQAEKAEVDMILVGDSLGMVVLGLDSTVQVTMDDMIHHTKAVKRGAKDTFVVTDMPFMSYHYSLEETMKNAARIMQESGADALKLEGGDGVFESIQALTRGGIPVVSHLGLTPQSVGVLGGYKVQGKDKESAQKLIEDSLKCEEAGAIALVLECVPGELTKRITDMLKIPVIGIGAGAEADGQVLVYHDVVGYGVSRTPKFVKQYAQIDAVLEEALIQYTKEVKARTFPEDAHTFHMKEEVLDGLYGGIKE